MLETQLILLTSLQLLQHKTSTNRVEFTFTAAATGKAHAIQAQTISGTIVDTGTSTASDKAFVAGDVVGAGGSGSTKTFTAS